MKKSLKPHDKLRLRSEFDYVRENGEKHVCPYCLLIIAPTPDGKLRAGVICGKKYSRKAVERNRARRLLWESFRFLKKQIRPCHITFIPRSKIRNASQPEVQIELETAMERAGIMNSSASA